MRRTGTRAWLRVGLAVALLTAVACRDPDRGSPRAEHQGGPSLISGSVISPPADRQLSDLEEEQPDAGGAQVSSTPVSAANLLQSEAAHLTAIDLVSCKSGKVLAVMPPPLLQRIKHAIARARPKRDTALTVPPWEAVLAFHLEDGRTLFGLLVRSDTLRVRWERRCSGARVPISELQLDEEGLALFTWLQKHLGPTQEREHQVPEELPPPPGL